MHYNQPAKIFRDENCEPEWSISAAFFTFENKRQVNYSHTDHKKILLVHNPDLVLPQLLAAR
jgi:hypothetical protein